jgi:hypothetical protein
LTISRVLQTLERAGFDIIGISEIPTFQKTIDVFTQEYGRKYIDTSRIYAGGTSLNRFSIDSYQKENVSLNNSKKKRRVWFEQFRFSLSGPDVDDMQRA